MESKDIRTLAICGTNILTDLISHIGNWPLGVGIGLERFVVERRLLPEAEHHPLIRLTKTGLVVGIGYFTLNDLTPDFKNVLDGIVFGSMSAELTHQLADSYNKTNSSVWTDLYDVARYLGNKTERAGRYILRKI